MNKHSFSQSFTTATRLVDSNDGRANLFIQNHGSTRVYLDRDSGVSTASPLYLEPGAALIDSDSHDDWWALPQSGTADVRGFEVF